MLILLKKFTLFSLFITSLYGVVDYGHNIKITYKNTINTIRGALWLVCDTGRILLNISAIGKATT